MTPGKPTYRNAAIGDDEKLPGLKLLADTIHQHGSLVIAQINHCGRHMNPEVMDMGMGMKDALSASDVRGASRDLAGSPNIVVKNPGQPILPWSIAWTRVLGK